jgi:aspartyl-tRNA(Asn)/glutamyl-tRNA(Gln) amidotransferase subunit C
MPYFWYMEVNGALVDKIARLAQLQFDETAKAAIQQDLQKMIRFADKLNEVDTSGVAPLLHVTGNVNILRADVATGSIDRAAGLQNAPMHDGQFFRVPKVIKK